MNDKHVDKLLLAVLFLFLIVIEMTVFFKAGYAQGLLSWLENIAGQVLAALLTLMVGNRLTNRNGDSSNTTVVTTTPPPDGGSAQPIGAVFQTNDGGK